MDQTDSRALHTIVFKGGARAAYLFDDATFAQLLADWREGATAGSYQVVLPGGDARTLALRFADVEAID